MPLIARRSSTGATPRGLFGREARSSRHRLVRGLLVGLAFGPLPLLPDTLAHAIGAVVLTVSCVYSLRALLRLVGTNLVLRPLARTASGDAPSGSNDRAPMKILPFLHELALGGATVNAIEPAASLRHGHDVVVFASPGPCASRCS